MKPSKIEFEVGGEDPNDPDGEIMFNVRCTVAPGSPGRLSGPPEDCYPAEPCEVDDLKVFKARDGDPDPNYKVEVPEKDWVKHGLDREMLEELAVEKANDYWQGLKEDYDEGREEARRERD